MAGVHFGSGQQTLVEHQVQDGGRGWWAPLDPFSDRLWEAGQAQGRQDRLRTLSPWERRCHSSVTLGLPSRPTAPELSLNLTAGTVGAQRPGSRLWVDHSMAALPEIPP